VVPLGTIEAVSVSLVMFKWVELVTFIVVWFGLTRAFPGESSVPLRHFGIGIGVLIGTVLAGIVVFPTQTVIAGQFSATIRQVRPVAAATAPVRPQQQPAQQQRRY